MEVVPESVDTALEDPEVLPSLSLDDSVDTTDTVNLSESPSCDASLEPAGPATEEERPPEDEPIPAASMILNVTHKSLAR